MVRDPLAKQSGVVNAVRLVHGLGVSRLQQMCFRKLSQQLVNLRIFKIDGDFARKAKAANPNVTVEDMVGQRMFEQRSSRD